MASKKQGWLSKILGGKKAQNKPEPQVQNAGSSAAEATQVVGRAAPSQESVSPQDARANVSLEWNVGDVILDKYEVKQIHSGGGMGLVYRVFHKDWELDIAVKNPRAEHFQNQQQKENFVRECLTWIGLGLHEHIVCCYYVRMLGNIPRVFAEYVEGGSLKDWIESKKLYEGGSEEALKRMLDIAIQAAWGLQHAHEQGLVHQDIKPANILLTPEGIAKVTDFGLAKARAATGEQTVHGGRQSILVSSGGHTPAYCSPEQANKQPLTRRTDIWSFGLCILEMFAGEVFWQTGQLAPQALQSYLDNGPEDNSIPKMPTGLANLLSKCFKQSSEERPRDMAEVISSLRQSYEQAIGGTYPREAPEPVTAWADALSNQGISLLDLGYPDEAEAKFEGAVTDDPLHPESVYNRGLFLWRSGHVTDTAVISQLAESEKSPEYKNRSRMLAARVHLERGDAESAIKKLEGVTDKRRDSVGFKRLLGSAHSEENCCGHCVRLFEGHTSSVESVAISPDGRWGGSGSCDKTLRLWDLSTGKCLRVFEGHTYSVESVAISPDGRWGLSVSWDTTLRLWELDWEYEFPGWADWSEGAQPYLTNFLTLHAPYAANLPSEGESSEEQICLSLTRKGKPTWTEDDFGQLLYTLGCAGYGWLRPEGVRRKLEEMAANWQGPLPLP